MTKEELTLIAAILAAFTSILSLFLGSKLTFNREKRTLRWNNEIERLQNLEEQIGIAQEVVSVYTSVEKLRADFIPLHENLEYVAGRFARYPELAKAIRGFVHACNLTVSAKIEHEDYREYKEMVSTEYIKVITECDRILEPKLLDSFVKRKT
ncbi:hypothetical protein [Moritella sp.]|uniref:hypothetical protein n=1 Tax=Moritella sp. TaxID=78556 RepID=UPI001D9EBE0A|nr:hypothetical protein [Moritella sp.]MCJ8350615.1 hypothetical protein [Moritella sp.]NQZ39606.1 hypothetical protein [Moritella sp.]